MVRSLTASLMITAILAGFFYWVFTTAYAQVMQSTNYQIQSDSVNFGGGYSSSTNYQQESTFGEIATGESTSTNFDLNAGYQQMQTVYLALSAIDDVTMNPEIGGISGGESDGVTDFVVTTDSSGGYQVTIEATNNPAMQSGSNTIADYSPAGAVPDFAFAYGVSEAVFGYSPEGIDVASRFLDNGSDTCGTGSTDSSLKCWDGLTTGAVVIATDSDANHPNGATTTLRFKVGVGSSAGVEAGTYAATSTITALPL